MTVCLTVLASLPEEERIPFLKHQVRKDAAARSLQEHDLEEGVNEDEDGYWHYDADGYWYWWYCEDHDGGADVSSLVRCQGTGGTIAFWQRYLDPGRRTRYRRLATGTTGTIAPGEVLRPVKPFQ